MHRTQRVGPGNARAWRSTYARWARRCGPLCALRARRPRCHPHLSPNAPQSNQSVISRELLAASRTRRLLVPLLVDQLGLNPRWPTSPINTRSRYEISAPEAIHADALMVLRPHANKGPLLRGAARRPWGESVLMRAKANPKLKLKKGPNHPAKLSIRVRVRDNLAICMGPL
jgi:hypothetical protein